jgi:NAD(P)H-dependent FMN reductase
MKNPIVILASARRDSNTLRALQATCPVRDYELIDLLDFSIAPYSYDSDYPAGDDFLAIARQMTEAEVVVFATPVYWYAMSGALKNFFDRLTDLISTQKPIGRALKERTCYLVACGSDPELPEGFEVPFRRTCEYFEMEFAGSFYTPIND